MGWLAKIFGAVPREEIRGIHLDRTRPFWELSGETDFPSLLTALPDLLPQQCVLYFEGGSPSGELLEFLRAHAVPERTHVAYGTIWPKPTVFHLPATTETMGRLAELTRFCAYPELAIHFHVYQSQSVLLEWHDVFTQPLLLSGELPEQSIRTFAQRLHMFLGVSAVCTVTRKHNSIVRGLAKFAKVTVGRADHLVVESALLEPQIILNGSVLLSLSDRDREAIEAARRGIREAEVGLGWRGAQHFVVKIEGLEVDGIDAEAACIAASQATRELIEK